VRLPGEPKQDGQDADGQDRNLHRSASDVPQSQLEHDQLPFCRDRIDPELSGQAWLSLPQLTASNQARAKFFVFRWGG
jgi:hypothetical protein